MGKSQCNVILLVMIKLVAVSCVTKIKLDQDGHEEVKTNIRNLIKTLDDSSTGQSMEDEHGISLIQRSKIAESGGAYSITHIDQLYQGVPVIGATIIREVERPHLFTPRLKSDPDAKPGKVKMMRKARDSLSGVYYDGLKAQLGNVDTKGKSERKLIEDVCRLHFKEEGHPESLTVPIDVQPVIYVTDITFIAQLAYQCVLNIDSQLYEPEAIVDKKGNILREWQRIETVKAGTGPGGNPRTGKYKYGTDRAKLTVTVEDRCLERSGDSCIKSKLMCIFETDQTKTIDLYHASLFEKYNKPFEYPCYEQDLDFTNGASSPLNDAHFHALKVMQIFQDKYAEFPFPVKPLSIKVHYGRNEENAFFFNKEVVIGDGGDRMYPLSTLQIVAHELGHAITSHTSALKYSSESGALSESFSDMTAQMAVYAVHGPEAVSFRFGDKTKKDGQIRCMDVPHCDGISISHISEYHAWLDVHHASGLFNFVFYKISMKMKYGVWDAYDIFYVANTRKWSFNTDFYDGAVGVLEATEDVINGAVPYSVAHIDIEIVVSAFKEVGINCAKLVSGWSCS